ncbi:MAG: glycine cleavage system aminomethyltransferase GcvT [Verrucomicrobiota bacterium]
MNLSPLDPMHRSLGARMAPFAGWEMPIQYEGIVAEHRAVRESVGIFDISHMGQLEVSGPNAESWLNHILTNDLTRLGDGEGQYTLMLNGEGGVIDDLIVYRMLADRYFLVVNAARIAEDWAWLGQHRSDGVELYDHSPHFGGIAVQGPRAAELWNQIEPDSPLPKRNGITVRADEVDLCRTGYTGEDGFELFAKSSEIGDWWTRLVDAGAKPCGLGARDTLRLEMGFPLNGSDLDAEHTPLEAGLGWAAKLDKPGGFIGAKVLKHQRENGIPTRLSALKMMGKAPPIRHGYAVLTSEADDQPGEVLTSLTSGSLSPTLGLGIGLAYLPRDEATVGRELRIQVRDRNFPAEITKRPFISS